MEKHGDSQAVASLKSRTPGWVTTHENYPWHSLPNLQAVPLKSLQKLFIAYITLGKGLRSLFELP